MEIATIGLDLAKHVFQVHGVDTAGAVVLKRRLRRRELVAFFARLKPCRVGVEACATAHFWARELRALGHEVRLMPAQYVKAYVRRGKSDAADAAAICEAVTRPSMRFVPVKEEEQQAALMLHRVRDLLVRQRTQLINAIRAHLAEFGMVEAKGPWNLRRLLATVEEETGLPEAVGGMVRLMAAQLEEAERHIADIDARILARYQAGITTRRLGTIPGVGPLTATAIAAMVPDPSAFKSGREFAAWLGLVPRQNSTGKTRLGRTSRQGDGYLRRLLVIGAQSALYCSKTTRANPWVQALLAKRPRKVVAVALANKMARIAWALLARGGTYKMTAVAA